MGATPITNSASTVTFKTLMALKTRNCILFSPHSGAAGVNAKVCRLLAEAAVEAGAPPYCIGWIDEPTPELSVMAAHHPSVTLVLATGGPGMRQAVNTTEKTTIRLGACNTPAVFHESTDIPSAVQR